MVAALIRFKHFIGWHGYSNVFRHDCGMVDYYHNRFEDRCHVCKRVVAEHTLFGDWG